MRRLVRAFSRSIAAASLVACSLPFAAQTTAGLQPSSAIKSLRPVPQANRIAEHANLTALTPLTGHIPRWVSNENLSSQAVDPLTTLRLTVVLRRDPAVEAAFDKLLADQQDRLSPMYHQWLTPQQIGDLFGPTQADVNTVTAWLSAQGFTVNSVAPSRMLLDVSGSVASATNAFHTDFGYYPVGGKIHVAAMQEPSIPAALAPVVRAIDGLADLPPEPASFGGAVQGPWRGGSTTAGTPQPAYTTSKGVHFLAPADFTAIYDLGSVYSSGNTGATIAGKAQHIAVIDRSDVAATDISEWAANVGLTSYNLNTILATATDPGQTANGDQLESTLDVNRTLSTAPGAVTDLIVAPNSTGGIFAAASYNVNTLKDPVMSISFYGCEANAGATNTMTWDTLFQTAAGEGITTFVCAGDSGAAGCANDFAAPPATTPVRSVNYICSSTYATCVGGTQFIDTGNPSQYWNATNSTGLESAISYIPEGAWNEAMQGSSYYIQSTGGGASKFIAKPSWQTGTGVPADGYRDQPDISFTSAAHDGYYSCLAYSGGDCSKGTFEYLAGTSAAAPDMAAITALLNTRAGTTQGNINPMLYQLAVSAPAAFHDITVATSGVGSCDVGTASVCNNSTPSQTALTGGLSGYAVTAGYDQATGLGSLDVANFLAAASPVSTSLALAPSAATITAGQSDSLIATLTPAAVSVAAPTGTVQFYAGGATIGSPVALTSSGTATLPLTGLTTGSYGYTAKYSGDTYFIASTSGTATVTVNPAPPFTLALSASSLSFTSGATANNTDVVTVTSTNAFAGTVALACTLTSSTAAYQPACSVSPTSVTLTGGGKSTATVTITSTTATTGGSGNSATAQTSRPLFRQHGLFAAGLGAVALFALLLFAAPARRLHNVLMLCLACVCATALVSGCSGSSSGTTTPTPPVTKSSAGTYTATVTGTSSSPAYTTTTTFTVTIN